jgi:hypothetical protein
MQSTYLQAAGAYLAAEYMADRHRTARNSEHLRAARERRQEQKAQRKAQRAARRAREGYTTAA